jgi:hypothetical protein
MRGVSFGVKLNIRTIQLLPGNSNLHVAMNSLALIIDLFSHQGRSFTASAAVDSGSKAPASPHQ